MEAAEATHTEAKSPFLALPRELRDLIYSFCFPPSREALLHHHLEHGEKSFLIRGFLGLNEPDLDLASFWDGMKKLGAYQKHLQECVGALSRTSRMLHTEVTEFYFENHTAHIYACLCDMRGAPRVIERTRRANLTLCPDHCCDTALARAMLLTQRQDVRQLLGGLQTLWLFPVVDVLLLALSQSLGNYVFTDLIKQLANCLSPNCKIFVKDFISGQVFETSREELTELIMASYIR